jgi:hypothetical protein
VRNATQPTDEVDDIDSRSRRHMLEMRSLLPAGQVITLLADRGFAHERLLHYLNQQRWHFRLRLPGDTLVHLSAQPVSAVRALCPPAGQERFFQRVSILGTAVGPVHLALAAPVDHPDDPWFVVSDEPTNARTLDEYSLRFGIEENKRSEKSGGYQIHLSQLATPEALERLILAIATLHLTSIGMGVVHAEKRRWVDPHWERRLSYLKLGWRWQRQQSQCAWQDFAPFWLDPAPDPFPVLASRRTVLRGNRGVDLPMAA